MFQESDQSKSLCDTPGILASCPRQKNFCQVGTMSSWLNGMAPSRATFEVC